MESSLPGDLEGADRKQILVFTVGETSYGLYLSTVEQVAERWRAAAASILSTLQNGKIYERPT